MSVVLVSVAFVVVVAFGAVFAVEVEAAFVVVDLAAVLEVVVDFVVVVFAAAFDAVVDALFVAVVFEAVVEVVFLVLFAGALSAGILANTAWS